MKQKPIEVLETYINKEYENLTGIAVWQHGSPVYEQYFHGANANSTMHIYSITKSVISLLIGIAINHGYIESVDQKVLDFFPDYQVSEKETTLQKITLKDMLCMRAPYKFQEEPYIDYFTSDDYVKFSLDVLGGSDPIGGFRYAALIGPDVLSGILVKVTGQSVLDFAKKHVFTPLGIHVNDSIVFQSAEEQFAFQQAMDISGWVRDEQGIHTAGWGLTLSTMDMAKIGQLYMNGGIWEGKQIVSAAWIRESICEHNRWIELNLPYGYLWWLDEEGCFMAMGDGGNVIYANPKHQLVIAISSMFMQEAKDRIALIKETIEPIFI